MLNGVGKEAEDGFYFLTLEKIRKCRNTITPDINSLAIHLPKKHDWKL